MIEKINSLEDKNLVEDFDENMGDYLQDLNQEDHYYQTVETFIELTYSSQTAKKISEDIIANFAKDGKIDLLSYNGKLYVDNYEDVESVIEDKCGIEADGEFAF